VNLGHPVGTESQTVGKLGLIQELFEPRGGRRAWRTLNFGKEAELHFLPIPFD
jgi:hypothetical protein